MSYPIKMEFVGTTTLIKKALEKIEQNFVTGYQPDINSLKLVLKTPSQLLAREGPTKKFKRLLACWET